MTKWTVGAVLPGILVGALSALICTVEAFAILMGLGDKYRHNYEYYLWLCGPILMISGTAGFCFPFAWLRRRGCRPEDVKALLGAIGRIFFSVLLAVVFVGGWIAATDSVVTLLASGDNNSWAVIHTIYIWASPVVTAAGFAVGIWLAERLSGKRKTKFLRIFAWPLVGCTMGAAAIFLIGPLVFSFGTTSLVIREVLAAKRSDGSGVK
jgi:hypothetical protein